VPKVETPVAQPKEGSERQAALVKEIKNLQEKTHILEDWMTNNPLTKGGDVTMDDQARAELEGLKQKMLVIKTRMESIMQLLGGETTTRTPSPTEQQKETTEQRGQSREQLEKIKTELEAYQKALSDYQEALVAWSHTSATPEFNAYKQQMEELVERLFENYSKTHSLTERSIQSLETVIQQEVEAVTKEMQSEPEVKTSVAEPSPATPAIQEASTQAKPTEDTKKTVEAPVVIETKAVTAEAVAPVSTTEVLNSKGVQRAMSKTKEQWAQATADSRQKRAKIQEEQTTYEQKLAAVTAEQQKTPSEHGKVMGGLLDAMTRETRIRATFTDKTTALSEQSHKIGLQAEELMALKTEEQGLVAKQEATNVSLSGVASRLNAVTAEIAALTGNAGASPTKEQQEKIETLKTEQKSLESEKQRLEAEQAQQETKRLNLRDKQQALAREMDSASQRLEAGAQELEALSKELTNAKAEVGRLSQAYQASLKKDQANGINHVDELGAGQSLLSAAEGIEGGHVDSGFAGGDYSGGGTMRGSGTAGEKYSTQAKSVGTSIDMIGAIAEVSDVLIGH